MVLPFSELPYLIKRGVGWFHYRFIKKRRFPEYLRKESCRELPARAVIGDFLLVFSDVLASRFAIQWHILNLSITCWNFWSFPFNKCDRFWHYTEPLKLTDACYSDCPLFDQGLAERFRHADWISYARSHNYKKYRKRRKRLVVSQV